MPTFSLASVADPGRRGLGAPRVFLVLFVIPMSEAGALVAPLLTVSLANVLTVELTRGDLWLGGERASVNKLALTFGP